MKLLHCIIFLFNISISFILYRGKSRVIDSWGDVSQKANNLVTFASLFPDNVFFNHQVTLRVGGYAALQTLRMAGKGVIYFIT